MKLDKETLTHKRYLQARKRLDIIRDLIRRTPWVKLKEPYQSGWNLIIILRDDYMKSNNGLIAKRIIERLRVNIVVKSPAHITQIRKKPALSSVRSILQGKKVYQWVSFPYIRSISIKDYEKLSVDEKKFFSFQKANKILGYWEDRYEFSIPYHYLVVKVEKRILTHTQDIDPNLLKEEAELEKLLAPYWRTCTYGEGIYHFFENRSKKRKAKSELKKELENIEI